jgi:hypothetical protein
MNHSEPTAVGAGRRRWALRLGAAAVAAGSVLAGAALGAGPAQAASGTIFHPEWVDGCPGCPGPVLSVANRVYDPQLVATVNTGIAKGLSGLIAAKRATDPGQAQQLHAAAIAQFTRAEAITGNAGFGTAADWDGDICPPWPPWPRPRPHWEVDGDVAAGLTLLGKAAVSKDPREAEALRGQASGVLDAGAGQLAGFEGYCSTQG